MPMLHVMSNHNPFANGAPRTKTSIEWKHDIDKKSPTPNPMKNILTYGTLQDPTLQRMVVGRELGDGQPALLHGFRHVGGDYTKGQIPMIDSTTIKGATIKGTVYLVDNDELKRIDRYEGQGYKRITAIANIGDAKRQGMVEVFVQRH